MLLPASWREFATRQACAKTCSAHEKALALAFIPNAVAIGFDISLEATCVFRPPIGRKGHA